MSFVPRRDECAQNEATTPRVGLLIDTEAYYQALANAIEVAQKSVYVLGWSFDPRTRLAPDGNEGPDDPDEIGHVLRTPVQNEAGPIGPATS